MTIFCWRKQLFTPELLIRAVPDYGYNVVKM